MQRHGTQQSLIPHRREQKTIVVLYCPNSVCVEEPVAEVAESNNQEHLIPFDELAEKLSITPCTLRRHPPSI